jgi:hypothetical protein
MLPAITIDKLTLLVLAIYLFLVVCRIKTINMSILKLSVIALVSMIFFIACDGPVKGKNGIVYTSAVQYNDYIIDRQTKLSKEMVNFYGAIELSIDSADQIMDKMQQQLEKSYTEISGMAPYKGDSTFREKGVRLFAFYKDEMIPTLREMISIRKKELTVSTEASTDPRMETLQAKIDDGEEKLVNDFLSVQKKFAKENKLRLEETPEQEKIRKKLEAEN